VFTNLKQIKLLRRTHLRGGGAAGGRGLKRVRGKNMIKAHQIQV
jgi:hypothetical protein